jgi:hypothetical protein
LNARSGHRALGRIRFGNRYKRLFPGYEQTIVTSAKQSQDQGRHGE